jgi:hypothetical protein
VIPAPVTLTVASEIAPPLAGHDYQFQVTIHNPGPKPAWDVDLYVRVPQTTRAKGSTPDGCVWTPGGLGCLHAWLAGRTTKTVSLTLHLAADLPGGTPLQVSAQLHYDWRMGASACLTRVVVAPPAPPRPKPPRPRPKRPRPTRPAPSPSPAAPRPSRSPAAVIVPPPSRPPARPAPHRVPRPRPAVSKPQTPPVYRAGAAQMLAAPPASPNKPVIPLTVLLTAVLTPCVAAAATRFGRGGR